MRWTIFDASRKGFCRNLLVKRFRKSVNIGLSYGKKKKTPRFFQCVVLDHLEFYSYIRVRVQNFTDLATFSVDFCILLYAECPPYFYFRVVWPTDLESIPHASTPTKIIPTKFEADMTINCRVIAFCLPMSRDLDLWPFDLEQVIHGESREQPCQQVWRP